MNIILQNYKNLINKYNIKQLFLENINHNEIIDLNKKEIDYSIFDNKETYSVLISAKRKHFRIN